MTIIALELMLKLLTMLTLIKKLIVVMMIKGRRLKIPVLKITIRIIKMPLNITVMIVIVRNIITLILINNDNKTIAVTKVIFIISVIMEK